MKAIYAETLEELQAKIIGLYHDRCHHLYHGRVKNIPSKYKELKDDKHIYCLIYRE